MNELKKQLISTIESLLSAEPLLDFTCYENAKQEKCISIFGFEALDKAQLPQLAKDVIAISKQLGKNASYLSPDRRNAEGSIYIGPPRENKKTVSEGVSDYI